MKVKKKQTKKPDKRRKSALQGSEIFLISPVVLYRSNMTGEITIIHTNDLDHHYTINEIAAEMWKNLDGRRSISEILTTVGKNSGLSQGKLLELASEVIEDLLENKLIRRLA